MVVPHGTEQATGKSELTATEPGCAHGRPARISWTRLLKRVFEIDMEHRPNCGGQLKTPGLRAEAAPDAGRARQEAMKREGLLDVLAVFRSGGGAAAQCAIGQAQTSHGRSAPSSRTRPTGPENMPFENPVPNKIMHA